MLLALDFLLSAQITIFIKTYRELHSYKNNRSKYSSFILIFVAIKIGLNVLAISHYGFHRDELLHLALGDHLDWGFKEVPPFIAASRESNFKSKSPHGN